jgi:hypothetical protein
MRSRRSMSLAAFVVLALAAIPVGALGTARTVAGPARVGAEQALARPYQGISYFDRTETSPRRLHMHTVQIDLAAPGLRFTLSPPAGRLEVVRQTTLAFLAQEHAQVAVNAHFFFPWPSQDAESFVLGIAASEGRVYSGFEAPEQTFALVADAPGLNIDPENHASIVHRDPSDPEGRHVREAVRLWTTVAGSAQIVTNGARTVPEYRDAQHPAAALTPGGPGGYSNQKSWYDALAARTAIGLSRDRGTLTLFTVDARGGSEGMRVGEVAELLMVDYGVWDALNLDGGGSTSMAMEDPVTHAPTLVTAAPADVTERAVGSSLAVFARRP